MVDHVEAERDGGLPCASGVKWRTRLYEVERGMCMWGEVVIREDEKQIDGKG